MLSKRAGAALLEWRVFLLLMESHGTTICLPVALVQWVMMGGTRWKIGCMAGAFAFRGAVVAIFKDKFLIKICMIFTRFS